MPEHVDDPTAGRVPTLYERVGEEFFDRLVEEFYVRVEADPVLLSLYPEPHDLAPARERLRLFLVQYWGGPTTYSDTRGHPRLRMRHAPYAIGERERDHWMAAMRPAVEACTHDAALRAELLAYFEPAATHMINRPG